jgi:periplasmic protein TonB
MSLNPSSRQSPAAGAQATVPVRGGRGYELTSDLAKLCLPATFRDENKKLAWANSVCLLFLLIGLAGLRPPKVAYQEPAGRIDIVPVIFTPPEEPPAAQPEVRADEPEPVSEAVPDAPVVASVVAADPAQVAFAVPVKGPVILAPARFAPPPPVEVKQEPAPPKPTRFVPSAGDAGQYPDPTYPRLALQQRHQGKVMLYVVVNLNGTPVSVEVKESSGHALLDKHAADWIKTRWQWPPGAARHYYVPIIFRIR